VRVGVGWGLSAACSSESKTKHGFYRIGDGGERTRIAYYRTVGRMCVYV
jgi:hypothetical protein